MRTVTSDVATAIGLKARRMFVKATFTQMRTYFSALTYNNPPTLTDIEPIEEFIVHPSAITYSSSYVRTALISDGKLKGMRHDSSSMSSITYSGTAILSISRPDVSGTKICWKQNASLNIYIGDIDWSTYAVTNRVTVGTALGNFSGGAVHILNSTMIAYITNSYGGFAVKLFHTADGGATWHEESTWDNAMMFPTRVIANAGLEVNYTAAANIGGSSTYATYVYFTNPEDGSIRGVMYDPTTARWSDTWIALQSDLSEFRITNALVYNSKVLLCGQFSRNGEEIKHDPVAMILTSDDGKFFSINQYALVSRLNYKFYGCINSNTIYMGDLNRIGTTTLGAEHGNTSATSTETTDVNSFEASSGANNSTATLSLKADDEVLINDAVVARLNRCKIEISYHPIVAAKWTHYDTYIVADATGDYADGKRVLNVSLVQEGIWKLSTQTPPYYTEIIGKNGILDELKDYGNMYATGAASRISTYFSVDMWGSQPYEDASGYTATDILDNGGVGATRHTANVSQAFQTADITSALVSVDYPEITANPVTVSVYGWARCKLGTSGQSVPDIAMGVILERSGKETYSACTLSSTYSKFPKDYPDSANGNNPITFILGSDASGTGIEVGDKIKHFVFFISGANDATWVIERAAVSSGIIVGYDANDNEAMEIVESSATHPGGFKIPGYGRYIMLSSRPYSAFDCIVSGTFTRNLGGSPTTSSAGISGYGLVVCAESSTNCIIARYQTNHTAGAHKIHIIKVRDGQETTLASSSSSYNTGDTHRLTFVHKGRKFLVYVDGSQSEETSPAVSYSWTVSDGAIATVDESELHVGLYLEKSPPNFRTSGFDIKIGKAIPVLVGEDLTQFNALASSGDVVIDDHKYHYTSKSGTTYALGPYSYCASYTKGVYNNGHDGYPSGNYYDLRLYQVLANSTQYERYLGYVLSSSSGFSRIIAYDDFQPPLVSAWDSGPDDRSTHTDNTDAPLEKLASGERMYIGPGLKTITKGDSQEDQSHGCGAFVYLYATEVYYCHNFSAFSGVNETTVKEIINVICKSVDASATFSGDFTDATQTLTGGTPWQVI
jgi:hypothetical protein